MTNPKTGFDYDPLVNALLESRARARQKNAQMKLERLEKYKSLSDILEFLADATPKQRENFLSPWKSEKASKGLGRPTKDSRQLYMSACKLRAEYESKDGKEFRGWKEFFIEYIRDTRPEMSVKERRSEAESMEHKISRAARVLNASYK